MSSARSPLSDLQRKPVSSVSQGNMTAATATMTKVGAPTTTKYVENITVIPVEETTVNMLIIETPEREVARPVHHTSPCGQPKPTCGQPKPTCAEPKPTCGQTPAVVVVEEVKVEEKKESYMGGAAGVIALIIWALVIFAAAYLLFYYFRPWFVLTDPNNPNSPIDTGKILLASFIVALIALIIIWLIKMAVSRK